ncbi:RcnB family protein [Dyella sp.]|jgi:Ni/Co efflux regulator RcnB|uniref:RcnB family protein n=1 Tax=Dyella sp. TaxID=1869338 RepID=UPI002D772D64|nr:RcnB family protein [Dyella sp.]HET6430743.1 RcnB family protein [Dyella sp.]
MKILVSTLLASVLLGGSGLVLAQPSYHGGEHGGYDQGRGHGHDRDGDRYDRDDRGPGHGHGPGRNWVPPGHRWERGHRYDGPVVVVRDYDHYRLREPPRGYHWVRGDDGQYLLVAIATGIILDIVLH